MGQASGTLAAFKASSFYHDSAASSFYLAVGFLVVVVALLVVFAIVGAVLQHKVRCVV
jgi:hypothetical protein